MSIYTLYYVRIYVCNMAGTDWRGIGLHILIGGRMKETDCDTYPNMYVDVTIDY